MLRTCKHARATAAELEPPAEGEVGGDDAPTAVDYSMSPEDLDKRLGGLTDCTTFTVFDFTRRGLFDRDKLIVTCLLTFRILQRDGAIDAGEFEALSAGKKNPAPPPAPNDLSRWISEAQWSSLSALCTTVPAFGSLAKEMDKNSDDWEKWAGQVRRRCCLYSVVCCCSRCLPALFFHIRPMVRTGCSHTCLLRSTLVWTRELKNAKGACRRARRRSSCRASGASRSRRAARRSNASSASSSSCA